ncbi:pyridoxamine 5'-phosphate oxidase family protein [Kitasatospora sp. NPDC004799]|uniref:pyridoxamine 5'-phosphate oxidase family protein n=1 Tax=Kitasatospora sp. NPDC004799 TaxID=3154460 RepID=UPI0033A5B5CE
MPSSDDELCTSAREILRSTRYLTLGTASPQAVPWVSALAHAWDDEDRFYWISGLDTLHSRNIAANPVVSLTVYDSNPAGGGGDALYALARAEVLEGADLVEGCELYYRRRYPDETARARRARPPQDFTGDSPVRIYRAQVTAYSMLSPAGHPVHGDEVNYRVTIPFSTKQLAD